MYQDIAWHITVVLVIAVLLLFAWVALGASQRNNYEPISSRASRVRVVVFWALVFLCTPIIVYSLSDLPYAPRNAQADSAEVVTATGHQWRWELSKSQVVVGKPVEFRVPVFTEGAFEGTLAELFKKLDVVPEQIAESSMLTGFFFSILPVLILLAVLYFLFRQQLKMAGRGAMSFGKSRARMLSMDKNKGHPIVSPKRSVQMTWRERPTSR